ncbi:MAG: hypothetical protein RI897_2930 [Verrucomicrobiota bacterium]
MKRRPRLVQARQTTLTLPTYLPEPPDPNPMFLEKRVYQGSSGRVYPLPCTNRIAEQATPHAWKAVYLENPYLKVLILPELGGRIHAILDKSNNYDLVYNQPVIKPALVGLAGPWISGGIELNWPQHHRPATFLPTDTHIENHPDGSITVWCSDHDPMCRMKGMHGVCLHPDQAVVELKVRAHNRTPYTQTFLWWANVATRVHEQYQSFFPPDVTSVADHARRSMSSYPLAQDTYYGVKYGPRASLGIPTNEQPRQFQPPRNHYPPNDLSYYANIPVPTSYMCIGSQHDFFGGYDHQAQAGIVHIANHHISPGKKQWTWGNHEFGYAWDRNLTDPNPQGTCDPYIEIMAGVYTDNQPDFSFLQPGETKAWSQYWYPIQKIGPAHHANLNAAVSLHLHTKSFDLGVATTRAYPNATIRLERANGSAAAEWTTNLAPDQPFLLHSPQARKPWQPGDTTLRVLDQSGQEIIAYHPHKPHRTPVPAPATEPLPPTDIRSIDELFLTGLHLHQYRHATRCPTPYWREALRRDPLDSRCNNALGLWHLHRGEFTEAEHHFQNAITRITQLNANPADGEPFYNLGLCLRFQGRISEAYAAFYKACWNRQWMAPGYLALAEIDCSRHHWQTAEEHLRTSLRHDTDNTRTRNLLTLTLQKLNRHSEAKTILAQTLQLDPLDHWALHIQNQTVRCDLQTALDIAHDYARAGFYNPAIHLLIHTQAQRTSALPTANLGAAPLVAYTLGWLELQQDNPKQALKLFNHAASLPPHYCFPARLEEIDVLQTAISAHPNDPRAPYYLGNLLYDRRRHHEAIRLWEQSVLLDPAYSVAWRNLGIAYFNIQRKPAKARQAYQRALQANPTDPRLLFEQDQLWKRTGVQPAKRLRTLQQHPHLVQQRDDLSLELSSLLNQAGRHLEALTLLSNRNFQPWEGGEGAPLAQWQHTHLALGQLALAHNQPQHARSHFESALNPPHNLGEAKHPLANPAHLHYHLGLALQQLGNQPAARQHFTLAATAQGDFQQMQVQTFSEMTCYSALALQQLRKHNQAKQLLQQLLHYARQLRKQKATIDYFATSLPTMLLFEDDLQLRQTLTATFLEAQAQLGLGHPAKAKQLLTSILQTNPNHTHAQQLLAPRFTLSAPAQELEARS